MSTLTEMLDRTAEWKKAARDAAIVAESYRLAWAHHYVTSTEKTDAARKAYADLSTGELRSQRDAAEIERDAAYHLMIFVRGSLAAVASEAA